MFRLVLRAIGASTIAIGFAFFTTWLVVNWISGCGETFYYADGSIHQGECVSVAELFIPFKE
jgi:hypothetical protein